MKSIGKVLILSLIFGFILSSCGKDPISDQNIKTPNLPDEPYDYMSSNQSVLDIHIPDFASLTSMFPDIEIGNPGFFDSTIKHGVSSNETASLGRVLFYDGQLSKNNSISCASCHQQKLAFADDKAFSPGFGGKETTRNSMALLNGSMNNNFFWDSRESSLVSLVSSPITNHIEMGMEDLDELADKLSKVSYYPELFEDAFGSPEITKEGISEAVSQFIASISTTQSTFDRAIDNDFNDFTELQKLGMGLFFSERAQCGSCHSGPNFAAADGAFSEYQITSGTANIGLDINYADNGKEQGQFKIPSLRNIGMTAPYMHDGRFETLREVLDHYNKGIQPHTNLDDKLEDSGTPIKLNLNSLELDALEAFLATLTDEELLTNPMFSNPF